MKADLEKLAERMREVAKFADGFNRHGKGQVSSQLVRKWAREIEAVVRKKGNE